MAFLRNNSPWQRKAMALAGDRLPPGGLAVPFPSQTPVLWHRPGCSGVFRTPQRDVRFVCVWRLEVATRAAWRSVVLTACGTLSRRQFLCLFFFNVNRKLINGFTIH